jgi:hypothetical protein
MIYIRVLVDWVADGDYRHIIKVHEKRRRSWEGAEDMPRGILSGISCFNPRIARGQSAFDSSQRNLRAA